MDSLRNSSHTEVPGSKFQVPGETETGRPETGDRRRGTSRIDDPLPAAAAASPEKERLIGRIELLREAWRHARGSQDLFADPKVAKALDLLTEATSRAEQQLVALSGLVAAPPPDEGYVACDVKGVVGPDDALQVGPLTIKRCRLWTSVLIRFGDRSETTVDLRPLAMDWRVTTDGRDYPEVVKAPPASAGGLSDPATPSLSHSVTQSLPLAAKAPPASAGGLSDPAAPSLRHSVTQSLPLVSTGQGDSQVDIREEDLIR